MFWKVSKKEAAARRSSKMESRDHSNAANPKSLTSRGNIFSHVLILLTVTMLLSLENIYAQSGTTGPLTWSFSGGTLTIGGSGTMPNYTTTNQPWNAYMSSITSVVIGSNVTSIGYYAFYNCSGLTSITIPNSVTSIGRNAFQLSGLTGISIPNNVSSIGFFAFSDCSALKNVRIEDGTVPLSFNIQTGNYDDQFSNTPIETLYLGRNIDGSARKPFCATATGNAALKSVTIGSNVTAINANSFFNCTGLETLKLGNNIITIGNDAFNGCSSISGELKIPNTVTTVGNGAFQNCRSLTDVTIPNSVTSLGYLAFSTCLNLKVVTIEDGTVALTFNIQTGNYDDQFSKTPIETLYLGRNINGTSRVPFRDNAVLNKVTIGKDVTMINGSSFQNCTGLQTLILGSALIEIGNNAFNGCSSLLGISIPNKVTTVGSGAFQGCRSLSFVTIPSSVTSIGSNAFNGCSALKTVTIEDGTVALTFGSDNDFTNAPIETLYMGRNINSTARVPFRNNAALSSVTIGNDVTAINGNSFSNCTGLQSVTLGNALITIGDNSFNGCSNLSGALTIPNKVTTVGAGAFLGCRSLPAVTIPNSVTSIGNDAFSGSSVLKIVTIEDGTVALTIGNDNAFANTSVETLYLGRNINSTARVPFRDKTTIKTVTIGNDVTAINANSFYNCTGMTNATIGSRVASLGTNAFYGCNGLKELRSLNPTPPTAPNNCFFDVYKTCTLFVPTGSEDKYRTATEWSKFFYPTYTLTASAGVGGSISPNGNVIVNQGSSQTFTATPSNGKEVDRWSLNGNVVQNGGNTYTVSNVQANATVQVTFKDTPVTYTLTATAGLGGSITPNGSVTVNKGGSQTFTATADINYEIDRWSLNGNVVQSGGKTYTVSNVQADAPVQVTFKKATGFETPNAPLAKIYPNPTDGLIHLVFESQGVHHVTVSTMNGTILLRQVVADENFRIDISIYPAGVYLLTIDDGKYQTITKIVKN